MESETQRSTAVDEMRAVIEMEIAYDNPVLNPGLKRALTLLSVIAHRAAPVVAQEAE